ncbi:MAG: type II toxin-antitoxin system PemK/MazF family toxin [Burkholderiaceae bacterium]
MKRGDLAAIALPGDFGKPRPSLVIQSDLFDEHPTVTVLLITSTLAEAPLLRVTIEPSKENGLQNRSQIMVDKAMTVRREKLGKPFGKVSNSTLQEVDRCLAVFLGIVR